MAKERGMTRKTTTVEHLPAREGDPIAGRLKDGMKEFARLTIGGYAGAYWTAMDDASARLDVFKRLAGQFMKKGELAYQQMDADEVEGYIIATWGSGVYQLRPMVANKYYSPVSMPYKIGDSGEDEKSGEKSDGIEELVGRLAVAKQLKELREGLMLGERKGEDEGMKAADMQAMMTAAMEPMKVMLDSTARRAEAAEQRNHELQMKMMDMASNRQSTQGSIAELVKMLPKEALGALLAPPDSPGWAEKAVDALREFGPALAQMLMEYFRPGGAATGVAASRVALTEGTPVAAGDMRPTETAESGGGNRMPIQLNAEQLEAKKMLVECIRERDFDNAYAMIENFPGFTPTPQGPMPIGAAFLSMVDPKVTKPRIYVIQMMQLVPELSGMLAEADAFVSYVQQRLMRDQEAYLKEQQARSAGGGSGDPRPTTREEDDRA